MTLNQTTRLRGKRARLKALAGRTSCGHLSNLIAASGSTRLLAAKTGMGLTGWGLVFLAGGLIFEIWVVLLTPDALQQHVQNSYFGKGGSADKKYKTLSQEEAGLRALTEPPPKSAPAEDFPYADPMTGFMVAP